MAPLTHARLVKSLTKLCSSIPTQYPSGPRLEALQSTINNSIAAARAGVDGDATAAGPGQIKHHLELRLNAINADFDQASDSDPAADDNDDSGFVEQSTDAISPPKQPKPSTTISKKPAVVFKRHISRPATVKAPAGVSKRTTRANTRSRPASMSSPKPQSNQERDAATALLDLFASSPPTVRSDVFLPVNGTKRVYSFTPLPDLSASDSREQIFFQGMQYAMRNVCGKTESAEEFHEFVMHGLGLRHDGGRVVHIVETTGWSVNDAGTGGQNGAAGKSFWDVI